MDSYLITDSIIISHYTCRTLQMSMGWPFFEVSAKDGTNIERAMTNMAARIWRTIIKSSADD